MVIAALVTFGALLVAWLAAPAEPALERVVAVEPEVLAEAA